MIKAFVAFGIICGILYGMAAAKAASAGVNVVSQYNQKIEMAANGQ